MTRYAGILLICFAICSVGQGAEIRLQSEVVVDGPIVRLGDVAELSAAFANEAESLADLQLFPAPIPKQSRYVRSREVIDLLVRRGVDFSIHEISGADVTKVTRAAETATNEATSPTRLSSLRVPERNAANEHLRTACLDYFRRQIAAAMPEEQLVGLEVKFDAEEQLIRAVLGSDSIRVVGQDSIATLGPQQVRVLVGEQEYPLSVEFAAPTGFVVAARPLTRGSVIRAIDLRMEYEQPGKINRVAFQTVEPLIGKQLTATVSEGRAIAKNNIREPIVVNRGDVVAVMVRIGGIEARTDGKAREDAAAGQVIEIESLTDRDRKFFARATGQLDPQTGLPIVEVFGGASTVEGN